MGKARPGCVKHRDCFANEGGRCACLKDNHFGGQDCPFYKKKGMVQAEDCRKGAEGR